jgi:hypothetical protein
MSEVEVHLLIGTACSRGDWEATLGEQIQRGFDRHLIEVGAAPETPVSKDEPSCMSIGALREAIVNATELGGVFGQNVHESKDVLLRVGDKSYPLSEVAVGFHAPTGRFVMYLTAEEAKEEPCRCPEHEPMSSDDKPRPVEAWSRCKRCKRLLWMGNGPEPDLL